MSKEIFRKCCHVALSVHVIYSLVPKLSNYYCAVMQGRTIIREPGYEAIHVRVPTAQPI